MHKFLNLRTDRIVKRRKWTELPIPKTITTRVTKLIAKDKANPIFEFSDRSGNEIVGVDDFDEANLPAGG